MVEIVEKKVISEFWARNAKKTSVSKGEGCTGNREIQLHGKLVSGQKIPAVRMQSLRQLHENPINLLFDQELSLLDAVVNSPERSGFHKNGGATGAAFHYKAVHAILEFAFYRNQITSIAEVEKFILQVAITKGGLQDALHSLAGLGM